MAIRMIAADMDGTLLTAEKTISPRTAAAIGAAMRAGALFVLNSGRMPEAMMNYVRELSVNAPIICFNGALTYDVVNEKPCAQIPLGSGVARAICEMAEELGEYIQGFWGDAYYYDTFTDKSRYYFERCGVAGHALGKPLSSSIACDVYKLLIITEAEKQKKLIPRLRLAFGEEAEFVASTPSFIEIIQSGASKGAALRALGAARGIAPSEIMAFGDEQNDLSMLQSVGYGYVMANASEAIRRQVRLVAPSNFEDGLAQVIERHLQNGEIERPREA